MLRKVIFLVLLVNKAAGLQKGYRTSKMLKYVSSIFTFGTQVSPRSFFFSHLRSIDFVAVDYWSQCKRHTSSSVTTVFAPDFEMNISHESRKS